MTIHAFGREFTAYAISLFGTEYQVFVTREQYRQGDGLAIRVWYIDPDYDEPDVFGDLTVNIPGHVAPAGHAFIKNWSENEYWAETLASAIGGKPAGVYARSQFVNAPLWDFSQADI